MKKKLIKHEHTKKKGKIAAFYKLYCKPSQLRKGDRKSCNNKRRQTQAVDENMTSKGNL